MNLLRSLTVILFILLTVLGAWNATGRALWTDEFFSLTSSIFCHSSSQIVAGGVEEGNNCPLFYLLLKKQCEFFSYHPPGQWLTGHWDGGHPVDQFFLRIQPILAGVLALCALFYLFGRRYGLIWGGYAMAVALSSSLFWFHWTEARPYALLYALSVFQMLCLLNILEKTHEEQGRDLYYLGLVHWLLALLSVVSAVQITAAAALLGFCRRIGPRGSLFLLIFPAAICGYYYLHAPHYPFFFVDGPLHLINANIPKDRLVLIFLPAAYILYRSRGKGWSKTLEMRFLIFLSLMLLGFGLELMLLKWGQSSGGWKGFQLSSRYFFSLTPAGVIGVVLFSSRYMVNAMPSRLWKIMTVVILSGFLLFRLGKTEFFDSIKSKIRSHFLTLDKGGDKYHVNATIS